MRLNTKRMSTTKFCTDLHNSGKVLNTSMTLQTLPPDPGVPQTPKSKRIKGEKTLCNVKYPDGWRKLIKFFPGSAGARLASLIYFENINGKTIKILFAPPHMDVRNHFVDVCAKSFAILLYIGQKLSVISAAYNSFLKCVTSRYVEDEKLNIFPIPFSPIHWF